MFDYENSPPSLNYSPSPSDQSQLPSRDTTPATPVVGGLPSGKRSEKERDHSLPWFKRPIDVGRITTSVTVDNTLLKPNFNEDSFPLFGTTPPHRGMANVGSAATAAQSTSPRGNQQSTLTSALRRSGSGESDTMDGASAMAVQTPPLPVGGSEMSSRDGAGTRPISVKGKGNEGRSNRRESIAQSLGVGMSWGGISVGSWIRDDMMMSGTSPFAFHQSPSYHSSSYLPKLEANFMRDFSCCGLTLPSLHDLLQHYEEAHAQKEPIPNDAAQQPPLPDSRAAIAANTAAQIQQEAQQRSQEQQGFQNGGAVRTFGGQNNMGRPNGFSSTLQTIPDMDTVDDMEMDDIDDGDESTPPSNQFIQGSTRASPSAQFPSQQAQVPQLNTNMMQSHQAYRNSTPTTPIASTRNSAAFQNASSTLMANPMQQFQDLQNPYRSTPDSSAPGTPGELDESLMAGLDDMNVSNNILFGGPQNGLGGFGYGMNNDMIDLCIDEPAKRLFQSNQGNNQQFSHNRLGSGQYGANSEIAKRIREQQVLAGLPDTTTNIAPHEEPKPFRCPVIGCEKAYKNQNGLKYHKSHGHNNQRLHENGDGTFSIVNPDTQAPYPGTQGMEKEKPYKCDVCQKRYKNLNGLKYHKTHSPPCNPDLAQNQNRPVGTTPAMMSNQNLNLGALGMGGPSGDTGMMG